MEQIAQIDTYDKSRKRMPSIDSPGVPLKFVPISNQKGKGKAIYDFSISPP
jgi:hypothetical protein